jgi:serine/threonine protein phosphatase PrpC
VEVAVKTHIGHIRQVNEDSAEVVRRENNTVLALIADGMGGHRAGDVASQLTLKTLKKAFEAVDLNRGASAWEDWLLKSIQEANHTIYQFAMNHDDCQGMGTTIVAALFLEDYYVLAHVGDSRIYRCTQNKFEAVTEDHSLVNELMRTGQITKEEAETHPQRNVITRALGTEEHVEVDLKTLSYLGNEFVLLCSDGLSDAVRDEQLAQVLSGDEWLEEKASKLMRHALDAGGEDNVTLILINTKNSIVTEDDNLEEK